jgi:hypothetical protein
MDVSSVLLGPQNSTQQQQQQQEQQQQNWIPNIANCCDNLIANTTLLWVSNLQYFSAAKVLAMTAAALL